VAVLPLLAWAACVDLTPPWEQGLASGAGGRGGIDDVYSPSAGGSSDPAGTGGGSESTDGASATGGQGAGGATGRIDSLSGDDVAELVEPIDGGAGGSPGDSGIDTPLGGAGGNSPDSAMDAKGIDASGPGGSTSGTGGASGKGGSGAGGRTNNGKGGSGGSGTGGIVGSGGSGAGGSADSGTVGSGGSGTGGSGTGGATVSTSGLALYYPCDETSGATLTDSSGNGRDASLMTGTGGTAGFSFGAGHVNNALHLVKASEGYASIVDTGLGTATEMTVAAWVYLNSSVEWQRVWDFGNSTTTQYMFLSPKSSVTKFIRFAITTGGLSTEQGLDGTAELAVGAWTHVAVVLGGGSVTLYIDGRQMATKTGLTLRPSDLGATINNYIGKSQYANTTEHDPYLDGNIDEFRVYSRALGAAEISILAGK
jgi:hypothetical protein